MIAQHANPCFICGDTRFSELYPGTFDESYRPEHVAITDHAYGTTGRIVRCDSCTMVSVDPRPPAEELIGLYEKLVDPEYQEEEAGRRESFRRVLGVVDRLGVPDRRALDIGAGTGLFVDEARRRGFQAVGIEPSHWAVETGRRELGAELVEGVLPHPAIPRRHYGLATLLDVIEHVDDPRALVRSAADVLAEGGLLVVTTPDFESLVHRVLGARWWHCRLAHVHYFSARTLRRLLTDCGFHVLRVMRIGWTFSMRYWMSRLERKPLVARMLRGLDHAAAGRWFLRRRVRINFGDSITLFARLPRRWLTQRRKGAKGIEGLRLSDSEPRA